MNSHVVFIRQELLSLIKELDDLIGLMKDEDMGPIEGGAQVS